MGGFFPYLPIRIPYSAGLAHWWDPFWWAFQIIVMSVLLMAFRKIAMSVDKDYDRPPYTKNKAPNSKQKPH